MPHVQKRIAPGANPGRCRQLPIILRTNCPGSLLAFTAFALLAGRSAGAVVHVSATAPVTLAWNATADPTVVGYYVYYGGASRDYTNKTAAGLGDSRSVSNLVAGIKYYFAATAHNAAGVESSFSSEVTYTVPKPPAAPLLVAAPLKPAVVTANTEIAVSSESAATVTASPAAKTAVSRMAAAVVPAPPPGLQLVVTPDQQHVLTLTGPANHTYDIQATPDFSAWTVIGTVTVDDSGSLFFTDTNAAGLSNRFYRTVDTTP